MELDYNILRDLYQGKKLSSHEIALIYKCSEGKVNYWLNKHNIPKRSISEAIYQLKNPNGDPFLFKKLIGSKDYFLFGLGLGLYWGEGNKKNKFSVRLGNTDPILILKFMEFLEKIFQVDKRKFKFGLQIFSDMDKNEALKYWQEFLKISRGQFQKVVITSPRGVGNYREKTKYGVLSLYFNNKKLRDILVNEIEKMRKVY